MTVVGRSGFTHPVSMQISKKEVRRHQVQRFWRAKLLSLVEGSSWLSCIDMQNKEPRVPKEAISEDRM
jgi:hypothetical protein